MTDSKNIPLVSSEVSGLWNAYMSDSLAIRVLSYFLNNVEDNETRGLLKNTMDLSVKHIPIITKLFNKEGLPIPNGFTENDVNVQAPRLFTDSFYLAYITFMARMGMHNYTLILNQVARADIRDYFSKFKGKDLSSKMFTELTQIFLDEGIPIPSTPESFVTDSTEPPFSEKLMLIYILMMTTAGISSQGMAIAESIRGDLQAKYMNFIKTE